MINVVQVRKFDTLPCSENFVSEHAATSKISDSWDLNLRRVIIIGMAGLIDCRNSATSTSITFRLKFFIPYLALRGLLMHLQLPQKRPTLGI